MADLIDRQAAKDAVAYAIKSGDCGAVIGSPLFNALDAVDAVEVVHGRWVYDFNLDEQNFYRCSVCDRQEVLLEKEDIYEYCPYCHCGAKMDQESENE